ncbi:hypothetical protein Tco_0369407 [Tanacetum coccineum]
MESSSSGTKEIKFVKAQKKVSSDGGPINMGGRHSTQAAPKIIMGLLPATPGSEKSVYFQKSILDPRPKHIIVTKPMIAKLHLPKESYNNYSGAKHSNQKERWATITQPHGFQVNWELGMAKSIRNRRENENPNRWGQGAGTGLAGSPDAGLGSEKEVGVGYGVGVGLWKSRNDDPDTLITSNRGPD